MRNETIINYKKDVYASRETYMGNYYFVTYVSSKVDKPPMSEGFKWWSGLVRFILNVSRETFDIRIHNCVYSSTNRLISRDDFIQKLNI